VANPTRLTHTTPWGRLTVGDFLDYVAPLVGRRKAGLTADQRLDAVLYLNLELEFWRGMIPELRGFTQQVQDYEWAGGGALDPASGDTQFELPDDYSTLSDHGRIYKLKLTGTPDINNPMVVGKAEDFRRAISEGIAPTDWDEELHPKAFFMGESSNRRRIIEIYPAQSDGAKFRVPYLAYCEKLVNNADTIEAPGEANQGIFAGAAAAFLAVYGSQDKVLIQEAKKADILKGLVGNPTRRESKAGLRQTFFGELQQDGYKGFRKGYPY
jgi:hypothetical protein